MMRSTAFMDADYDGMNTRTNGVVPATRHGTPIRRDRGRAETRRATPFRHVVDDATPYRPRDPRPLIILPPPRRCGSPLRGGDLYPFRRLVDGKSFRFWWVSPVVEKTAVGEMQKGRSRSVYRDKTRRLVPYVVWEGKVAIL
ncbi:hypothetical protein BHM03_00005636 [Ensete ventricosum]|nr:hypothetical protein BHM03_00005636 [Ensete ventricosum]